MSQIVKLRRSSVSGQKPTNSNLQLGELALNTTDGKVYMAKSGSLGPTVEELISTNTVNTGSINLIGDITGSIFTGSFKGDGSQLYNVPLSGVTNLLTVSGSIDNRLDVLEAYSSSQYVPTSSFSERTLQIDVYCKNISGTQINKGQVVRVYDSVGDNPLIRLADNSVEQNSANTLGIATQNIPNDSFGMVITAGILIGVNTDGMVAGTILYLGTNGSYTTVKPISPIHGVRLGQVIRPHQNVGSILVRVDNGIELDEAHDVTYTNISQGDLLVRNGNGVWNNSKQLHGNYAITGSLTISQNLTVLGSSSLVYVTSSNLAVSASFISVNVFEPAERFGGLKVYDSGSSTATASLAWDSQHNHWVYQNVNGSQYSGGMLLSGPRNSGSLGDEPELISGRIVKSVGGDHIDVSIISETGTTINVDGNLVANSITGSFDFFGLVNRPTLVSGSSQIEITGTTGYSTFSGSISSSIGSLSSSVATTTSNITNNFNSFTSSYTTGSFTGSFTGNGGGLYNIPASGVTGLSLDKIVSGPYSASISSTRGFEVNVGSTFEDNMLIRHSGSINLLTVLGNHESYAQLNLKNTNTGSSASGDIVVTSDSGDESIHYVDLGINSSTYDAGYVGYANDSYLLNSGEDLYIGTIGGGIHSSDLHLFTQNNWENPQIHISGSKQIGFNTSSVSNGYQYEFSGSIKGKNNLTIVGSISSSMFTGSFKGDGGQLYNIPASGVTGLSLFQITSGSATASISPNNGLVINVDTTITGSMTLSGSLIFPTEGIVTTGLGTPQIGSKLIIADDGGGGLVGWNSTALSVAYNPSLISTYPVGSTIVWQDGSTATIVQWDDYGPTYIDLFWDTPKTGTLFPITLKTSDYVDASPASTWRFNSSGSLITPGDIILSGSLIATNSVTASVFTGSFKGDGSQLYNIPASGVTGLSLDKIVNGNASASIDNNGFYVNRDVYIDGTITAKEIHTDYVTSSVLFQSGSTKFGNTSDDTHQFTGSLHINDEASDFAIVGNIFGQTYLQSLNGALVLNPGYGGVNINGANPNLKVDGYVNVDGFISSSTNFRGDGSGLYNLPYTGLTGVPTLISGSSQILDLGFTTTSSFNSFTSSYVIDSSSFDSRINIITGSLNGLTSTFNSFTSSINIFTSSVLLSSQTSSMTVLSSSYAVTASYALNGGGGGTEGRTSKLEQTVISDTWTFAHNLGEKYPSIEVFDENDYVIIPTNILAVDENNLTITFSHEITGVATATVGGGLPYISGSYNGRVLAVNAGSPSWKEGIISGSLQVTNFGFATTGSNSFKDNQIITGSVTVRNAKMDATCVTITSNTTIFDLGSYDGAIFDYVVKNGGNMRAGTITGVWNGSIVSYNETSTVDMGTTSNINFNVTSTGRLNAVILGGTWQVEVFYRALGCSL